MPAAAERPDVSPELSDAPAPSADPASEPAEVKDFVSADNVFLGLDLASRDGALSFVSNEAVKLGIADDADELMAAFLKREDEGSTGMMDGFAIPHAKSATVKRAAVVVVKDDGGIEGWESMDGAPVNVAIALFDSCVPGRDDPSQASVQGRRGAHGRRVPLDGQVRRRRAGDRGSYQRATRLACCFPGRAPCNRHPHRAGPHRARRPVFQMGADGCGRWRERVNSPCSGVLELYSPRDAVH